MLQFILGGVRIDIWTHLMRECIINYVHQSERSVSEMAKKKVYEEDFKKMIVELYENKKPICEIKREYGLCEATLYRWIKEYGKIKTETGEVTNNHEMKKLKKEIKKNIKDGQYTIQPTTFKNSMSKGWFEGLIVWPIAQIINLISSKTDAGVGIILTTLLIQMLVFVFTRKSQMSTQRMQEIQPEIQKIQNKYKDKTDERSKMQMAQEMQNIYQKYDIHPFGSMLITFIQLPIMMGMYYATMRSVSVVSGSFMGISLAGTPLDGFKAFDIAYISIYVLMVIFYIVSMKLPQWLKKWQDKKDNVKVKKYAQNDGNPMANSMNMYMYFMTAMICIMYISWPMAMSFYWLVSSVIRVCQSLILHKVMNKK